MSTVEQRDEFGARIEAELLDENTKQTRAAAAARAAAMEASDLSDASVRREVRRILGDLRSEDFTEGSPQQKARYLREYKQQVVEERKANEVDRTKVLDERMGQENELDRRSRLARRN